MTDPTTDSTNPNNSTTTTTTTTESPDGLLEQCFVYQNTKTGDVSSTQISARQLCKILSIGTTHITPATQVLSVLQNGQYAAEWKTARDVPVLQESCNQYHYVAAPSGETRGPVGCKRLSQLLVATTNGTNREGDNVTVETRVWSPQQPSMGWFQIKDSNTLQAALKAFEPVPVPSEDVQGQQESPETEKEKNQQHGQQEVGGAHSTGTGRNDDATQKLDESVDASKNREIQDELDAFLKSTGDGNDQSNNPNGMDEEGYQSDGGTNYVKDPRTGDWIHEGLAPKRQPEESTNNTNQGKAARTGTPRAVGSNGGNSQMNGTTKKRKKAKFSSKNMKNWVYVTGLPSDCTEQEVSTFFSKAGILDLDPESQRPKIKLYRSKDGSKKLKGDGSICYARPESVQLALTLLDDAPFRPMVDPTSGKLSVTRAKFEQHGQSYDTNKKPKKSNAKRKVARLAALQAVQWDDTGENGRITGGLKGLCIVVLKNMFDPKDIDQNDDALQKLEQGTHELCAGFGTVEKMTVFAKNPEGVMVVKFAQPQAASTAVQELDGKPRDGRIMEAIFWDGVTDYTVRDEKAEEKATNERHEEFGNWLDSQELPEELRLQVEDD